MIMRSIRSITFTIIAILPLLAFGEEVDLKKAAEQIKAFIFAEKFAEAEPLVQQCLQQAPEKLYFLSQLDMVLNGQRKYQEADQLRDRIRAIWEKHEKANWIAAGSPVSKATWARMRIPARKYYIVGTEYFQPEVLGSEFTITSFYKIIAQPKIEGNETRVFKLEMSNVAEEFYVLRELLKDGGGQQIIQYGGKKPDFRTIVADAQHYLDAEK